MLVLLEFTAAAAAGPIIDDSEIIDRHSDIDSDDVPRMIKYSKNENLSSAIEKGELIDTWNRHSRKLN